MAGQAGAPTARTAGAPTARTFGPNDIAGAPGSGGMQQPPEGFTGGGGGRAITPWTNSKTGETWNAPNTGFVPPIVTGNKVVIIQERHLLGLGRMMNVH